MKRILASTGLVILTLIFIAFAVAESSFPESFLTFTDQDWLIDIWPHAYRYNVHFAITSIVIAGLLLIPAVKVQKEYATKLLETVFRIGIGGLFIMGSAHKIMDPLSFATEVAQYQFYSAFGLDFVTNFFALYLPQLELWCGIMMIATPFVREAAFGIFWMFISFIIALSWAIINELGIACGCFDIPGAQSESETVTAIVRDLILIWPTLWLAFRKDRSIIGIWKKK